MTSFIGENISETAIREVKEETGIETEFVSLLSFRHIHEFRWGTDDLYFVCLLRPLSSNVKIDEQEISACKWIDVSLTLEVNFKQVIFLFCTLITL